MAVLELPPEDGEHIGRYQIVRILGRGGMGEVLLAWDPDLNRSVAIKRIRHDSATTPVLRQRLLQEAFAAGSLHHPAIVTVHDLLKYEEDDCIVMEYVPGQTLAGMLKEGSLEPALAVRLAKRVAAGLAAAHEAGFIHRDLKTENVMITPSEEVKILDFGLAKPIGLAAVDPSLTLDGHVVGTPRSMAPEQATGGVVDERSDLFSFGVLLYEMLTGISPFQGADLAETRGKVQRDQPPCVDTLRPGLPPRLVALVYRLLEKAPGVRPQSAGEVARELEAISALLSPGGQDPDVTLSDLPTGENGPWRGEPTPAISPSVAVPTPPPETLRLPRRRRNVLIAIVLSLLVLVAVAIFYQIRSTRAPVKLLRIVVPRPEVGNDPRLQLAASGLLNAGLDTLGSLRGIAAVDPLEIKGSPRTSKEIALAAAADEVLIIGLEKESSGNLGLITLRCIQGSDGQDLWADRFQGSLDPLSLGRHLDSRLRAHFSNHSSTTHSLPLEVRDEDYSAFLNIQQRFQKGQTFLEPELPRLEAIIEGSPNFLDARLLAADVAINVFQSKRDADSHQRAERLVKQAELRASDDPRPLRTRFWLELADGQPKVAAKTLSRLEDLMPGDPQNLTLQAKLAEARGDLREALSDQQEAVEQVPSWANLLTLANLEERQGMVPEARLHLQKILDDSPGNIWAREHLGELELDFGDPRNAERIYRELISQSTERTSTLPFRTNLGTALVLLGRYPDAVTAFQESLEIAPDDVAATLNLADTEDGLGHVKQADALYGKVLRQLEANHPKGNFSFYDEMIEAQCLAHLGHLHEATMIVRNALRQNPDNPDVTFTAALVYTLAGDYDDALEMIQNAIAKHGCPNWFKVPAFAPLFKDPRYQRILGGATR